jgi:hypothetical protein
MQVTVSGMSHDMNQSILLPISFFLLGGNLITRHCNIFRQDTGRCYNSTESRPAPLPQLLASSVSLAALLPEHHIAANIDHFGYLTLNSLGSPSD